MKAYEKLQTARSQLRPTSRAYIERLFTERTELHGDRKYADDAAIIGGIGPHRHAAHRRQAHKG